MNESQPLELDHKDSQISYRWRKSARAKRFRVTVGPDGVDVVTPNGASQRDAERFLKLHADWVVAQQERIQKLESRRRPPGAAMAKLAAGMILIQGREFKLEIREEASRKTRARVEETSRTIRVKVPAGGKDAAEVAITSFLKNKATKLIPVMVTTLSTRLGKKPAKVSIRSQKSRWGSCSSRGTLSFNWRLVMVPPEILNYVILHELVHLEEPNHSPRFWQKLAASDPECQQHRRWLRENQSYLYDPLIR